MARAPRRSDMQDRLDAIQAEIARYARELDKLRAQETLLLDIMDKKPAPPIGRARKGSVKTVVIDLLTEVGEAGINATTAVELAEAKGIHIERGSVSSLLSRLSKDGVVTYDQQVYRLAKFPAGHNVSHLRPSGGSVFG